MIRKNGDLVLDFPICSWPAGRDSSLRPSYITNVSVRYGVLDSIMRAQLVDLSCTLSVGLTVRRGYNIWTAVSWMLFKTPLMANCFQL